MKFSVCVGHFLFGAVLFCSSCKLLLESPEKQVSLLSRFSSLNAPVCSTDSAKAAIKVELRSDLVPDTPVPPKTLLSFSNQGQKALINALDKRAKTTDDLNSLLAATYFEDNENGNVIDFTTKTVSLTISVQNQDFFGVTAGNILLADRLEKIRLKLTMDQPGILKFKSWNKINTQVGRFYIGNRSYTGSQTGTLSPSLGVGTATVSLGSLAGTNQYVESDTLSERYMSSNGVLHDYDFTIEQDGTPQTTLMGNTIVQLTLKADKTDSEQAIVLDSMSGKDGKANTPDKVKVSFKTILFPESDGEPKNLTGTLSFDYVYRHVAKGYKTFAESDDTVTYYYGTVKNHPVNIVMAADQKPKLYLLTFNHNFLKIKNTDITDPNEKPADLAFLSSAAAGSFLNWLLSTAPSVEKKILLSKKYEMYIQDGRGNLTLLNKTISLAHPVIVTQP